MKKDHGATLALENECRKMKVYPLTETEIIMIDSLAHQKAAWVSAAVMLFGLSITIIISACFVDPLPQHGKILALYGAPVLSAVALACWLISRAADNNKASLLRIVESQCQKDEGQKEE